ncbi:MAG: glycosyltransferase [Phascolarctobacterium sp.]|nr:glycosyltransferase [Phascolarctobacterium sp.]
MKIMQICFTPIINSAGGVEKVYCNMSNHFCKEHQVFDVCCDGIDGEPFYKLDSSVKFYNLTGGQKLKIPFVVKIKNELARVVKQSGGKIEFPREKFVRQQINGRLKNYIDTIQPDVVICYEMRSMVAVEECGYDLNKVIVMFHSTTVNILNSLSNKQEEVLRKVGCVQVLMNSDREHLLKRGYQKVVHIGNVVPQYEVANSIEKENIIIHVGRLDGAQKRQHLLIEAFAKIAHKYPDWKVEFWGGDSQPKSYEDKLKGLIKKYGLERQVFLMGKTNDVPSKLRKASIFAFPSAFEGFGLGLAEAMSMGLPVIGFKSCPAVNELIVDGVNGILCDDGAENFAKALEILINNEELRGVYGMRGRWDMKKWDDGVIYKQWENIILLL